MTNFIEVFIYSDQPTSCPKCDSRTEIILDLSHTMDETQIHKCLNKKCEYEFVMQYDIDFDNSSLL